MSKSLIRRVVEAGMQHEMPEYLERRLVPTNLISLVMLCGIAIPFIVITMIYFPGLEIYPIGGAIVTSLCIVINYFGGIKHSRIMIATAPIILGAVYNAYLSNAGDDPLPSLYLIELSFALIPFVVYDMREKGYLIVATIFCAMVILSFPITKHWFTSDHNSEILRNGWLSTLTIALSIVCEVGLVLGLSNINKQSENKSAALLADMDEKNKEMVKSQSELQEYLKKVEKAQDEEKKRNWATQGIASVADVLRSNHESQKIFDDLLSLIINYTKSNQGGIFVVDRDEEDEEVKIILKSCYAYSRKKYMEKEYVPGQGLIGQAYMEGEYIHMTKIPDNYVNITSGLGEATPKTLIILPLKVNDIIEGILEIASFKPFEPYQLEFLEKMGENIASYIQSNRINERTNKLLNETKETAEEMRAQEEEMRQNMEELSATQEEMARKENEYQNLINSLQTENQILKDKNQILQKENPEIEGNKQISFEASGEEMENKETAKQKVKR